MYKFVPFIFDCIQFTYYNLQKFNNYVKTLEWTYKNDILIKA